MVKHRHGVGTFVKEKEVGVEMDQLDEEMEAKQVTVSDRTLPSGGPARPV